MSAYPSPDPKPIPNLAHGAGRIPILMQAQTLSPIRWQVVREDAARVQELLRSQAAELAAAQMLVSQLEAPPWQAAAVSQRQQELEDLRGQLQVRVLAVLEQGWYILTSWRGRAVDIYKDSFSRLAVQVAWLRQHNMDSLSASTVACAAPMQQPRQARSLPRDSLAQSLVVPIMHHNHSHA